MTIQNVVLSIDDPGIGRAIDAKVIPMICGTADAGSTTVAKSFGKPTAALDEYTAGPLAVALAHALRHGGRPVRALRLPSVVAAIESVVSRVGATGPAMTIGGSANDDYAVRAEVVKSGGVSVGRIKYTLDAFDEDNFKATFTGEITIDGTGDVLMPGTGMTLEFGAVTDLFLGETYSFTTTGPHYGVTEINAAFVILKAFALDFRFVTFVGQAADITTALLDLAAIKSGTIDLFNNKKYVLSMAGVSRDTPANIIAEPYVFDSIEVSPQYGFEYVLSSAPINGRAVSKVSKPVVACARAARSVISTDLSRAASGQLEDVVGIDHDEFELASGLDDLRISTSRTHVEQPGFYFTEIWMGSAEGSDFMYWQHALVMRIACQTVANGMFKYLSATLRTGAGGVLDAAEAKDIDADINKSLEDNLLRPLNAEGNRGHASAALFAIDDDVDVLSGSELTGELSVQPNFYPKTITIRLGFRRIL